MSLGTYSKKSLAVRIVFSTEKFCTGNKLALTDFSLLYESQAKRREGVSPQQTPNRLINIGNGVGQTVKSIAR